MSAQTVIASALATRTSELPTPRFHSVPGNHRVGLSAPIADIFTECFPVGPKFQSLSYGPAIALAGNQWPLKARGTAQ